MKEPSFNTVVFIALLVGGFIIGGLTYLAITYRLAYKNVLAQLQIAYVTTDARTIVRYGVVLSVDTQREIITIQSRDPFAPDDTSQTLEIVVRPQTVIIHQGLVADDNGVYVALSSIERATLADIPASAHVYVYAISTGGQSLQAQQIVFGEPL
jgi:hypothetical protein